MGTRREDLEEQARDAFNRTQDGGTNPRDASDAPAGEAINEAIRRASDKSSNQNSSD